MSDDILIITRHDGLVEWLARRGIVGKRLDRAGKANVQDKDVYGSLPMYLASETRSYTCVAISRDQFSKEHRELSADDMDRLGARLETYTVRRVKR